MNNIVETRSENLPVETQAITKFDTSQEPEDLKQLLTEVGFVRALQSMGHLLTERYGRKDADARRSYNRLVHTMFANYDNKFNGLVNRNMEWHDFETGANDYSFSLPLLKAHVDTYMTFYSKTNPRYVFTSVINSYRYNQLAGMCQKIATREMNRLMSYSNVQKEALYTALAGKSTRRLEMEVDTRSRMHRKSSTAETVKTGDDARCNNCGHNFFVPTYVEDPTCSRCLSDNTTPVQEVFTSKREQVSYRTPRVQMYVDNPVSVQMDYQDESSFVVKRSSVERYKAEFQYKREFNQFIGVTAEADSLYEANREPLAMGDDLYNLSSSALGLKDYLTNVFENANRRLPVTEIWADPCDYGLIKIKGKFGFEYFPDGIYMKLVNGELVEVKHRKRRQCWIEVVAGERPASRSGAGLQHLARLNDLVNNAYNLEYSIMRTQFPVTVIRAQYLQDIMPEANNAILLDNVPETLTNEQIVSRLSPMNASGTIGILSSRLEGIMQYVGATFNFNSASPDMRQMMNTATGASAIQEMMTDRLGLVLQRRIEADIEMQYSILQMLQENRSPEQEEEFREEFDKETVDMFYETDLASVMQITTEKGTDTPSLESLNVYKMQTFAQLTASLTGLREFDKGGFEDLISAIGDSLNIPVELGAGRKERHYAQIQISKLESHYQDYIQKNPSAQETPDAIALKILKLVTDEEQLMLSVVPEVEMDMFDHASIAEVCSDWVMSKSGIESPLPVKLGVVMLYGYHHMIVKQKEQNAKLEALQMEMMLRDKGKAEAVEGAGAEATGGGGEETPAPASSTEEGAVPENVKRDGTTGAGRPREVDSPEEVAQTLGQGV